MRPAAPLRVVVQARDPVRRQGLLALLAEAGHAAAEAADDADVVVCDVGMGDAPPDGSGPALVVLTDQAGLERDRRFAAVLPRALAPAAFQAALAAVAAGLVVRTPAAALPAGGEFHPAGDEAGVGLLTPREVEILTAIGEGLSNKEIARRLGISTHTVKFHLEAIFDKLDAGSRAEAVAKGLRRGVIEL